MGSWELEKLSAKMKFQHVLPFREFYEAGEKPLLESPSGKIASPRRRFQLEKIRDTDLSVENAGFIT